MFLSVPFRRRRTPEEAQQRPAKGRRSEGEEEGRDDAVDANGARGRVSRRRRRHDRPDRVRDVSQGPAEPEGQQGREEGQEGRRVPRSFAGVEDVLDRKVRFVSVENITVLVFGR